MSNDTPPHACLADFGFITKTFEPDQQLSYSAQMEGGTLTFMAPELLVPDMYGTGSTLPTPQADIYAFGLVIFQVCGKGTGIARFLYVFSRSSRVKPHSAVFRNRRSDTMCFVGCARTDQRTPQPSGSLIRCGVSLNVVGMVGKNRDHGLGKL